MKALNSTAWELTHGNTIIPSLSYGDQFLVWYIKYWNGLYLRLFLDSLGSKEKTESLPFDICATFVTSILQVSLSS